MLTEKIILDKLVESFPFEKIRNEQLQAFNKLTPWLLKVFNEPQMSHYFGCDAPTGIGKAAIALSIARAVSSLSKDFSMQEEDSEDDETFVARTAQVWIVTQNKLLQDQYIKDFGNAVFDLRGLDNYECHHDPGKSCGTSLCARIKPPKGVSPTPPKYCSRDCGYDILLLFL